MTYSLTRTASLLAGVSMAILTLAGCSRPPASPLKPAYYHPDPATVGTITGRVTFTGRKPVLKVVDMDGDPQCAKLHGEPVSDEEVLVTHTATGQGGEDRLANVFVYLKAGLEGKSFEPPAEPIVIEQRGCWFGPRVQGIMVGQTLKVVNSDPLTHNIHPMAVVNREWNQSQSPGEPPFTRRFSQPEVMVRIKCNIHNWMHAWVGAVAHPYFAVTGKDGTFSLAGVPPGSYTIEAWHEKLGRQELQLTLSATGRSELIFNFKGE